MAKHLLTDALVRKAKPDAKAYRLFDGDGLALRIAPSGVKSWQLRYRLTIVSTKAYSLPVAGIR